MRKLIILAMGLSLLTGCAESGGQQATSNSQNASTTPPTSQTQASTTASNEGEEKVTDKLAKNNLVGTWEQKATKTILIVDPLGQWQLSGGIKAQGKLKLALDSGHTQLVKLFGFSANNGGIGNYFTVQYNADSSKMNFGYLGEFIRKTHITARLGDSVNAKGKVVENIYLPQSLLGTWTMANRDYDFQAQWNFNPDGTFEVYSEGKGEADSGTYHVDYLEGQHFTLTTTMKSTGDTETTEFILEDGEMYQPGFEWAAMIRNTIPTIPND